MRVKDLPAPRPQRTVTSIDGKVSRQHVRQPILYCRHCMGEYSGNPDGYAAMSPETILRCCRADLTLVDKGVVYTEVKLELSDRDPLGGNDVC